MRKTRYIAAAALATAALAASAGSASAASLPGVVDGTVGDSLSVGATTPAHMSLVLGGYSAPANATVTVLDTTPATAHTVTVSDSGNAATGRVAGFLQKVGALSGSQLVNPVEVGTDNTFGTSAALGSSPFTVFSGTTPGGLLTHNVDVWYRQLVGANEPLTATDVYTLTATYTVT